MMFGNDEHTIALYHFEGSSGDISGNGLLDSSIGGSANNITNLLNETEINSAAYKFGNTSICFDPMDGDGYPDGFRTESSPDFGFSSGSFTFDFWANHIWLDMEDHFFSIGNFQNLWVAYLGSTNEIYLSIDGSQYSTSINPLSTNIWNHFAFVRNYDKFYIFVNGSYENVINISASHEVDQGYLFVGVSDYTDQYSVGTWAFFDEFRVKNEDATENSEDPLYINDGNKTTGFIVPSGTYVEFSNSGITDSLIFTSYGISEPKPKLGTNFDNIITRCSFSTIYRGQYTESSGISYIYGAASGDATNYNISFYADSEKNYKIFEYNTTATSGENIAITGSGVGVGIVGTFDYSLGI